LLPLLLLQLWLLLLLLLCRLAEAGLHGLQESGGWRVTLLLPMRLLLLLLLCCLASCRRVHLHRLWLR
jgi:hypothetical protein